MSRLLDDVSDMSFAPCLANLIVIAVNSESANWEMGRMFINSGGAIWAEWVPEQGGWPKQWLSLTEHVGVVNRFKVRQRVGLDVHVYHLGHPVVVLVLRHHGQHIARDDVSIEKALTRQELQAVICTGKTMSALRKPRPGSNLHRQNDVSTEKAPARQ